MTADAPTLLATGRIVGAATNTAAFIRAQHARGVSVETLRRQLKIKAEHVLELLTHAPEPLLPAAPRAAETKFSEAWSEARRELGNGRRNVGGSPEMIAARGKMHREEAKALADRAIYVVAVITGVAENRILGRDTDDEAVKARSMVYGLIDEISPGLTRAAIGDALGRVSTTIDSGITRCHRFRDDDGRFRRRYQLALARLTS